MFNIGDRIAYPMHGAGIIKAIEEKDMMGTVSQFYLVHIVSEGMDISVPVNKANESGLRPVVDEAGIELMLYSLKGPRGEIIQNWSKRSQDNLRKLKTGDVKICAHVVRDLTLMDRTKGLSSGEKRMLFGAKNFLISEIMMVRGITKPEADDLIEGCIGTDPE